ncbi:MAG: hypothetical protein JOZ81_24060 [Chloroflexi bacterium]|nr:hypothetical protein [Chloroflexota bacterium]
MASPSIATILRDHVSLSIACVDRLYLNGYVPLLQAPGQVATFCRQQLGAPIPSPALFRPLLERFVHDVETFAEQRQVPIIHFGRDQKKDAVAAEQRARFTADQGVVFIGVAQEKASSFKAHRDPTQPGVSFTFSRQPVFVNQYYFYLQDRDWGPAFIKLGTYLPYPVRVCLNGHEWVKQQARRQGLAFEALDNGFGWCADPDRLQRICDRLSPGDVQRFFDCWLRRLPWPLTSADRAAGYRHRLTIWQLELSLTQVFDAPRYGRQFFEALICDNLDLGRPQRVNLLFPTRLTRRTPPPRGGYHTRVITTGVAPSVHVGYKHTDIKQYFKEGRALRTETTINDPRDFQPTKALATLDHLRTIGQDINRRLLEAERLNHACSLEPTRFERLQQPIDLGRRRVSALRFGDPRVHALLQALSRFAHVPEGFQNRDLRPLVAALLGRPLEAYSRGAMTYDLRRLRVHGLIQRLPGTHRYMVTLDGWQVAGFYTTLYDHVLSPGWAVLAQPATHTPEPLARALRQLADVTSSLFHQINPPQSVAA